MPSFLLVNLTKLEKRKNKHVVLCYRRKTSDVRNKSIFSSFPLAHILGLKTFFRLHPCRLPGRQSGRKIPEGNTEGKVWKKSGKNSWVLTPTYSTNVFPESIVGLSICLPEWNWERIRLKFLGSISAALSVLLARQFLVIEPTILELWD